MVALVALSLAGRVRLHGAYCITVLQSPQNAFQQTEIFRLGTMNGLKFLIDSNGLEAGFTQQRCNVTSSCTL
ncbi:hypothetical protein D3C72_2423880 [compost metagenome]